ncbi:HD-GYP domain-containing protein [Pseudodesulfovibrio sediminis]|uniref:HD-GYP domain-containing protein n=1 Tax=Pseudodesulfovibrio sediminis TaxID=2810563 RepID=A0ABN6EW56_9BACT|nr:HD-GYP domain-containing protein [Pseudodesulfovibrio sediminis]BCS89083.1 hypothetical protein PSDVSF_23250 [Pseudodesulfovibrio sediminis]
MTVPDNFMSAEEARKAMEKDPNLTLVDQAQDPSISHGPPMSSIKDELVRADRMYGEALGYAHEFMDAVRQGQPFHFKDATPLVSGFIDSVFRNESAAAAISKLKSFDHYTYTHCINVSILAVILGKKLGYSRKKLQEIGMAGMFHDVGKAVIPDTILNKPGKLNKKEMNVMRTHPLRGFEILKAQQEIPDAVLRAALEHHERHDGSGYPRGLKGDEISDISRLLAVVDVYDALTSKRVYKDPLPPSKVLGMMYKWRVTEFSPNIVEEFIKSLGVYPVGSFVQLSNGNHGVVVDNDTTDPLRPTVKVVYDAAMRQLPVQEICLAASDLTITEVVNPDDHKIKVYRLI